MEWWWIQRQAHDDYLMLRLGQTEQMGKSESAELVLSREALATRN
jgi:hypothetical protein